MKSWNLVRVRKKFRIAKLLLSIPVLTMSTACAVFGGATVEEAAYELVRKDEPFEIRDYAPMVVVETRVTGDTKKAGNKAFRKLFAYISGENESSQEIAMTAPVIAESNSGGSGTKIAMTAPVTSQKDGEAWRYRFVLPGSFSLADAPRPLNPEVSLAESDEQRVAVIRYSGRATEKAQIKNAKKLIDWIEAEGLVSQSEPKWAGYDAPWVLPPYRRNEVMIDIGVQ